MSYLFNNFVSVLLVFVCFSFLTPLFSFLASFCFCFCFVFLLVCVAFFLFLVCFLSLFLISSSQLKKKYRTSLLFFCLFLLLLFAVLVFVCVCFPAFVRGPFVWVRCLFPSFFLSRCLCSVVFFRPRAMYCLLSLSDCYSTSIALFAFI